MVAIDDVGGAVLVAPLLFPVFLDSKLQEGASQHVIVTEGYSVSLQPLKSRQHSHHKRSWSCTRSPSQ